MHASRFLRHFARLIRQPSESAEQAMARARAALPTVAALADEASEAALRRARAA